MTVICPSCDARFQDPPKEILITRPLQCSTCEHEWVRSAESETVRISVDAPSLEPSMESLVENTDDAIISNLPVVTKDDSEVADLEPAPLYVDREAHSAPKTSPLYMPVGALALVAVLAGSIFLRDQIINTVPQAHSAYSAAGLVSPAPGLEIAKVQTSSTTKDGIRQLIIRGEIENVAAHQVPIPPLQLTMRGESKVRLYAWTISAAKNQLKAGERSQFTAIARNYPGEAVDVEVEFLPAKDK